VSAISGKKILIGITGGIAVYKTCEVVRLFVKAGAEVRVVATKNALEFITPLTLETLSRNHVETELFPDDGKADARHITLARWADLVVLAPASANLLAKMRTGIADDLLTTTLLAYEGKILVAPAMNTAMWNHPATQENVAVLKQRGLLFIGPEFGEMAAANEQSGIGRMTEPELLFLSVDRLLDWNNALRDVPVLVVAGPTTEPIDAVRAITNRSTGALGIAIAERFYRCGAKVKLLLGDTPRTAPYGIESSRFSTVDSLHKLLEENVPEYRVWVMAAAVSDRRPVNADPMKKIKKDALGDSIKWEPTPDLLATLSAKKKENQYVVGFALEDNWNAGEANRKLREKHLDLLVWNNPLGLRSGFGDADIEARLVDADSIEDIGIVSRSDLADTLVLRCIAKLIGGKQ